MLAFVTIPGSANEAVIVTQGGVIYRLALDGSSPPAMFGDVSGLLIANPGNEEGLLGLAFSPTFATDGRVFIYYVAGNPTRSVLARFNVVNGEMDMASERVILEVPQPFDNHKGGQLAFGPDGYLYWGLGDGGSEGDPQQNGQKLSTLLSSILRLDVSGDTYAIPTTTRSSTSRAHCRRSTLMACATPGASASIPRRAISGLATLGRTSGRRSIALTPAGTTAGA